VRFAVIDFYGGGLTEREFLPDAHGCVDPFRADPLYRRLLERMNLG